MNDKDIIRITKVDNVRVENTHNGFMFPVQNILEIEYRDGGVRVLDLMAQRDISDISYLVVHDSPKTKRKDLFKENDD
jgi:hypothetical protein